MPQFDKVTFFNQIFWFLIIFFFLYFISLKTLLPSLGVGLKTRTKLPTFIGFINLTYDLSPKNLYFRNLLFYSHQTNLLLN
uniref:ATP synthase F0 subunit 8 n=1 Tax=Vischeria sp. CAUP Q 202 TaxID=1805947 RepID=A0A140F2V5_9STRA|nr:ATP synthase F0 subunit 8 [Vischeria punctata]AML60739.1 ATP synthase F0 subunit 8 [Vischeria sp. CAUP Q 202]UUA03923.1 ATP synthase F0 subunit 8 [Vischeria punctata]